MRQSLLKKQNKNQPSWVWKYRWYLGSGITVIIIIILIVIFVILPRLHSSLSTPTLTPSPSSSSKERGTLVKYTWTLINKTGSPIGNVQIKDKIANSSIMLPALIDQYTFTISSVTRQKIDLSSPPSIHGIIYAFGSIIGSNNGYEPGSYTISGYQGNYQIISNNPMMPSMIPSSVYPNSLPPKF